jgi:hypothetical protein
MAGAVGSGTGDPVGAPTFTADGVLRGKGADIEGPKAGDDSEAVGCGRRPGSHRARLRCIWQSRKSAYKTALEGEQNDSENPLFSINLQGFMAVILLLYWEHTRFLSRLMNAARQPESFDGGI